MIITEHVDAPFEYNINQYGLGYYTDRKTDRLYFYSSYVTRIRDKYKIYRFEVDQVPITWEYIGEVDFEMNHVCVSPCGHYFWSFERTPRGFARRNQQLFFRQIDIATLENVVFQVHGSLTREVEINISTVYLRYTSHGTFAFFFTGIFEETTYGSIDLAYHLNVNEAQKCLYLTPIDLPILATGDSIDCNSLDGPHFYKKWHIGLVEVQNEVYFYRLDFDGEIFFINWNSSKSSGNWENRGKKDRNIFCNSVRVYLSDGLFYQQHCDEKDTIFYQLDIQPKNTSLQIVFYL
ncbi:hypothetical protein M3Y98_00412700 [Aphelenchoides besseyi]|nr:hypothetical protein M3Y98_00412700 [Aphelenchoides besseyi]